MKQSYERAVQESSIIAGTDDDLLRKGAMVADDGVKSR